MNKVQNNKAWLLVLPVFVLVAFSAIIPIMTVVNYSVQDIFDQNNAYFVGAEWYREMLSSPRLLDSLLRQFGFSFAVLAIQIPLGIGVALMIFPIFKEFWRPTDHPWGITSVGYSVSDQAPPI